MVFIKFILLYWPIYFVELVVQIYNKKWLFLKLFGNIINVYDVFIFGEKQIVGMLSL